MFELDRVLFEEKMTVPELVKRSGVNKNTLYNIKNNTLTRVDLDVLERICNALRRPLSAWMKYEPSGSDDGAVVHFDARHQRSRKGLVFVISGPSGAGKNTLINQLKGLDLGLHYIPSFTTRAMRPGERQGEPYYFVNLEDFQQMAARGEFLEYEQIHGNFYGTHAKTYEYAIEHGYDAIKDIDVNGALNFQKRFKGHVVLIYVRPTSLDTLSSRLVTRGDKQEDIALRMQRIQLEESKRHHFDYVVYNDDIASAKARLLEIIQSKT
ncbi:MAG: guanylate kinase [Alicyclobacillus sp.]|nr:guanylate kinase [Alicyclobacillus sp.]